MFKYKYDLTLCQSHLHTASKTFKKFRSYYIFCIFFIRSMHFDRKGWGIRKNGKTYGKIRTHRAMTFIHAITMNKDIRFLGISKQGSKSMQKQTPQISPICEQIIQIGELYIRNHWQDQTQKKDLFDSGTLLNTSRRLTVNNDLDLFLAQDNSYWFRIQTWRYSTPVWSPF